jgi:hypothetical protein
LDKAKTIGRSLILAIVSMTCRLNALPFVLTPMIAVGLIDSIARTKSLVGACGCA